MVVVCCGSVWVCVGVVCDRDWVCVGVWVLLLEGLLPELEGLLPELDGVLPELGAGDADRGLLVAGA